MSSILNNPISHTDSTNNNDSKKRTSQTYRDSNIFGYKNADNKNLTENAREDLLKKNQTKINPTFSSNALPEGGPFIQQRTNEQYNYNYPVNQNEKHHAKDHTTAEMFGSYQHEYEPEEDLQNFEPKYNMVSANERKHKQDFGYDPSDIPKVENIQDQRDYCDTVNNNPVQRRVYDQISNIFNVEKDENRFNTGKVYVAKNSSRDDSRNKFSEESNNLAYALERKKYEMASNIFNVEKQSYDVTPISEPYVDQNIERRKKDKNFSDLFNLATYDNPNSKNQKAIMPSNAKWSQVDSVKNNPFKQENAKYSQENINKPPLAKKKEGLVSCMDNFDYEPVEINKEELDHTEKKFVLEKGKNSKDLVQLQNQSRVLPNYQLPSDNVVIENSPQVYDYDIQGFDPLFEEAKFKRICQRNGFHIVDFQTQFNNISNTLNSGGRLRIRTGNVENSDDLKGKLTEMGLSVTNHLEKTTKTSNYLGVNKVDWKENNLQAEERRLHSKNFLNAKDSKMKELESQGNIFGNSEGVGQWDKEWKDKKMLNKKNSEEITKEDVVGYGNWNKAMKTLDYKLKKFAPVLKKEENKSSQPVFQPHSMRQAKII